MAAGLCLYVFATAAEVAPPRFSLTVVVVDSITKKPLEYASISVPEAHQNSITDAAGSVLYDSLPTGFYTVHCAFVGYHNFIQKVWVDRNVTLRIELCPQNFHLHEVEVTGHHDELQNMTLQTRAVLDAKRIEQTRGLTLSDQLKQLPGVSLLSTGPTVTKPVIRGLHSNRLVTLNNGVRQEGQQWGNDHGTEIDPFAPARIEVIKGASSVEYGAEAIGGVVKISPREFKNDKGINGELQLMGASNNGLGAGSLLLEGAHFSTHRLSWRVQGTFRKAGDSRTPDYVMSNTGFEETDGSYALHYAYKGFHAELSQSYFSTALGILRASHIGNTTDLLTTIANGKPAYTAPFTYKIDKPKQEVDHVISALKLYYEFRPGAKIQLLLSRQTNERKEFDRPPRWATSQLYTETPAYYLTLTTHQAEIKFEHARWNNIKGQWGVSYMNQGNYSEGLQPIIPNFRAHTAGAYLIEKWNKGRWMAESGIRYDLRQQSKYSIVQNEIQRDNKSFGNATFATGASFLFNRFVKVQGNLSSAWRPPSINELYSYGLHGGTASFEVGNSELKPERSYNSELALEIRHEQWTIDLSAYRNRIDNFIYKVPLPEPTITIRGAFPQFRFVQDDALLQGADLDLKRSYGVHYYTGLNASYLHAQNLSQNTPLIFMPANRTRITAGYENGKWRKLSGIFANVQYSYVAHQGRYPKQMDYIDPPPAYQLVDVNLGFEIYIGKQPLRWGLSVYNLFDTSYRDYLSRFRYYTLDPGRNVMLRLAVPFNIYQPKK
jgi:iron complex outermembrane recepter protein